MHLAIAFNLAIAFHLALAFHFAAQIHTCMHLRPGLPCDSFPSCDSFPPCCPDPPMHACMHFCLSTLPPRSTLDRARYATRASPAHQSHNYDQICDRNCDSFCDSIFGPDPLHYRIHFNIRSILNMCRYMHRSTLVSI